MPENTNFVNKPIRSSLIPTTGYVAGTVIDNAHNDYNQLVIHWDVTLGSLTSAELKVEFSSDGGTTYFQETNKAVSGGTTTLTVNEYTTTTTGKYEIKIPILARHIKISAKGTGTLTNSLIAVDALLGYV